MITHAFRSLRRAPAFAVTAILTLALGIGLATAVFTVADAMLLRSLPVQDQDGLVVLWGEMRNGSFPHYPTHLTDARAFVRDARPLAAAAFAAYEGSQPAAIVEDGGIVRLRRGLVSGDFFDVMGVRPVLGRGLRPTDDVAGAARVVVLSHAAWRGHFGADPGVVGRQMVLHENGVAHTIVGVMPQGLDYPRGTDFWAALVPARARPGTDSIYAPVDIVGRLAAGATPATARQALTRFHADSKNPIYRELTGVVTSLPRLVLGDARPAVLAFAAAAALLLLITCIDVANLLLVRGLARGREVAVRLALGASRARVAAQLLVEHALLALAGGALGLLVAWGAVRAFLAAAPDGLPRLDEIGLNPMALLGATAITLLAMLVFGVAPALATTRVQAGEALRSGLRGSPSRGARRATETLVAAQVALALLVLSAAALIGRSLLRLENAELSVASSRLLVAELAFRQDRLAGPAQQRAALERLLPAVAALPEVRGVSPVVSKPFPGGGGWDGAPPVEGQSDEDAARNPMLNMEVVTPSYFATLGMPVLRGRAFTDADREGAPRVVMLSERAAEHYWPGEDPIGKRLRMQTGPMTVVGIVPETRWRDLREARASVYFPLAQPLFPYVPSTLAIRTSGDPSRVIASLRRVVAETEPGIALARAAPFEEHLEAPLAQPRLNALLLAAFAGAAVLLAAVGLFGVLATMVRQRTRELGVRMALGASPGEVIRLVLRRGLLLAAAGTGVGVLAALATNRLLASLLFEVAPTDPLTLGGAALLLLAVAAVASLLPARAGGRVQPMEALRGD